MRKTRHSPWFRFDISFLPKHYEIQSRQKVNWNGSISNWDQENCAITKMSKSMDINNGAEPKRSPLSEALQKPPDSSFFNSYMSTGSTGMNGETAYSNPPSSFSSQDQKPGPEIKDIVIKEEVREPQENHGSSGPTTTAAGLSLDRLLQNSQSAAGEGFGGKLNSTNSNASSLFCNICSRSFTSVFGLVAHKYRDHAGVGLDTTPLPANIQPPAGARGPPTTPQKENGDLLQAVDPEAYCELCQKEFCSKYFLKTHKMNIHGIAPSEGVDTPPSATGVVSGNASSPSKLSATINAVLESAINGTSTPSSPAAGSPSRNFTGTPNSVNGRPRYVTGKNFCDICNKEVCNKYFLRTHMLKMHGIVIDENKTVIGNINTVDKEKVGNLVFRCDICQKEASSRQFLKVHKLNAHGISTPPESEENSIHLPPNVTVSSDGGPPSSACAVESPDKGLDPQDLYSKGSKYIELYKEVCPMCDRRFKGLKWLQAHILTEHDAGINGDDEPTQEPAAAQPETTAISTTETGAERTAKCEYCPMSFDDVIQLQLHIIGQHAMEVHGRAKSLAEQTALNSFLTTRARAQEEERGEDNKNLHKTSPPMVVKHNGTKLYRCSYCHYYTKWLSNLSVHERRHTGDAPRDEKVYVCNICLRSYRYAHSLERHRVVHRISANASFQFFNGLRSPQKSPEKTANLNDSVDWSDAGGTPTGYGSSSQKQATGAKRFRCTKCQKVFRSRELCRSHLFAVHRRQEFYGTMSPQKNLDHRSPGSFQSPDRAFLNRLTSQAVSENDPISQVVEAVHTEKLSTSSAAIYAEDAKSELDDIESVDEDLAPESGNDPKAYAAPLAEGENKRPYSIQAFKMHLDGKSGQNGERTPFFEQMIVYLPVLKRVESPVDIGRVFLVPNNTSDSIFTV